MATVNTLQHAVRERLTAYLNDPLNATQETQWLLCHVLNISPAQLITQRDHIVSAHNEHRIMTLLEQRTTQHMPLAYLLGTVPFGDLLLHIAPPVLIPRPETEEMVAWLTTTLADHNAHDIALLDLCTGSGCIGLSVAKQLPHAMVTGVDINPDAVALAKKNADHLTIDNITIRHSDMFAAVAGKTFDVIVSNPPYLSEDEWQQLPPTVQTWESKQALVATDNGLAAYAHIAREARAYCSADSPAPFQLVLEVGHTQAEAVTALLNTHGWHNIVCHTDLSGKKRWLSAA